MKSAKILFLGVFLIVVGCASATTTVLAPPSGTSVKSSSIQIVKGEDTVPVDPEYGSYFREKLADALYSVGGFENAEGLTLQYRFIQLDQGSRAARYLLGPIAGKGTMTIEIVFLDLDGNETSRIHTGGEVVGGFAGGSFKSALEKAAKEASEYARNNYLP